MKQIFHVFLNSKLLFPLFFCLAFFLLFAKPTFAVTYFTNFQQARGNTISATVGSTHLSIQGYQSPFASIVLTTEGGVFLRSTVADSNGYFTITDVLINDSVSTYCLEAIDFKRIGESDACFTLDKPFSGNITKAGIFLPPTIGLSKKQIAAGQNALIYGYCMPYATVYLNIEGKIITLTADANGLYQYTYKNVKAGVYRLFATATLNGTKSLTPTNNAVLEALSLPAQINQATNNIGQQIKKKIPFDWTLLIIGGLIFLIAIGILLYKLKIRIWVIFIDFLRRRKKMHHDYFLDFWQ